jgi:hypothetical protein
MSAWMFFGAAIFCWGVLMGAALVWWGYLWKSYDKGDN